MESDIWRSKFLASTLILEEVTRAKQGAEARGQLVEHAARYTGDSEDKLFIPVLWTVEDPDPNSTIFFI